MASIRDSSSRGSGECVDLSLTESLDALPAQDAATVERVMRSLIDGGPAIVEKLVEMIGAVGDEQNVKPQYALHGLAVYVSGPGLESDRRMVAAAFARQLAGGYSADVKAFLVRQLQLCGGPAEASALGKLLEDERLCEEAARALVAVAEEESVVVLRQVLGRVAGRQRMAIVQALGLLGDKESIGLIQSEAEGSDAEGQQVALDALAEIGDPTSACVLRGACDVASAGPRAKATGAYLRFAQRLGEQGHSRDAEAVLRYLLTTRTPTAEPHVCCAALAGLVDLLGVKAKQDVLDALGSDDTVFRARVALTAMRLAKLLMEDDRDVATSILKKIPSATKDEVLLGEVRSLLGKPGV